MPRRFLIALMVVLFLDATAMSMIMPALPHLLVDLTGTSFGEAAFLGGLLSASFALMLFLCGPLVGNLSDRYGRRPVMLLAIGTNCLDFVILSVSPVFWFLFVGRILAGITGACFTVAGGYMADLTPADKRASAFGMVAGTFALGMVIGPALGGYLAAFGLRAPFFAAAALSAISVAAIWLFLPGMPYDYYRIQAGPEDEPGIDGGIGAIADTPTAEGRPLTQVTIAVPSVDDCVDRVVKAGGKVIEPKMPIPGIGWFAACAEPGGLLFGVIEADPESK